MPASIALQPGRYYHIYNRGNNRENLFIEDRNYVYFLKLYVKYIEPIVETYAYCLLRNHFHFLVRINDPLASDKPPSKHFSDFFNAYARAFNSTYGRVGALFQRPFGRIEVTSDIYFVRLVTYIHCNPQKHGLIDDFRAWPYSSYHTLLSSGATRLRRDSVMEWFQGRDQFIAAHRQPSNERVISALVAEDFDG